MLLMDELPGASKIEVSEATCVPLHSIGSQIFGLDSIAFDPTEFPIYLRHECTSATTLR